MSLNFKLIFKWVWVKYFVIYQSKWNDINNSLIFPSIIVITDNLQSSTNCLTDVPSG
jgi:hypothetical protein